jgi:hypothetical protein
MSTWTFTLDGRDFELTVSGITFSTIEDTIEVTVEDDGDEWSIDAITVHRMGGGLVDLQAADAIHRALWSAIAAQCAISSDFADARDAALTLDGIELAGAASWAREHSLGLRDVI